MQLKDQKIKLIGTGQATITRDLTFLQEVDDTPYAILDLDEDTAILVWEKDGEWQNEY